MADGGGRVRLDRPRPHVALVTLDRPEKRNAVDAAMAAAIEAIVTETEADADVRAVVLCSSHPAVFCAGADLGAVAAGRQAGIETAAGGFAGLVYAPRAKPWIAAVEGLALAGGMELVLACDMTVAGRDAAFGLPEVRRGLIAAAGGVHRLANRLPPAIAFEMIAAGTPVAAAALHGWGLVNRLVPAGEALAAALELAGTIAGNAPLAVQAALAAARDSLGRSDAEGRAIVAGRFAALRGTADFAEGPRAFVEKREPVWTGR